MAQAEPRAQVPRPTRRRSVSGSGEVREIGFRLIRTGPPFRPVGLVKCPPPGMEIVIITLSSGKAGRMQRSTLSPSGAISTVKPVC